VPLRLSQQLLQFANQGVNGKRLSGTGNRSARLIKSQRWCSPARISWTVIRRVLADIMPILTVEVRKVQLRKIGWYPLGFRLQGVRRRRSQAE
jgi:hypothetical protein